MLPWGCWRLFEVYRCWNCTCDEICCCRCGFALKNGKGRGILRTFTEVSCSVSKFPTEPAKPDKNVILGC